MNGRSGQPIVAEHPRRWAGSLPGQVVLVLQGGGALGAYQAGVYQALHEAGIEPDWIIGTSIGAINASLIAGNAPEDRLSRLQEFWKRMEQRPVWSFRRRVSGLQRKTVLLVDGDATAFPGSSSPIRSPMPAPTIRSAPTGPDIIRPNRSSRRSANSSISTW